MLLMLLAKEHEECLQDLTASNNNLASTNKELVRVINFNLRRPRQPSAVFSYIFLIKLYFFTFSVRSFLFWFKF